jgi:hypothetical protein
MSKESVSRISYPRSGDFLSFARWFSDLPLDQKLLAFVSPSKDDPHTYTYAVFPVALPLTAESQALITTAKAIAARMGSNGTAAREAKPNPSIDPSPQTV